jgi:hypothetical protein
MASGPVTRTDPTEIIRDHEVRISRLERSPGRPAIRFNEDNEGGWLYINTNETNDDFPPGGSYGMYLVDSSGGGIFIGVLDTDGPIRIGGAGTNYPAIEIDGDTGIEIATADADGQIVGVALVHTGTKFQVTDHLGAVIFEVDEDGTITGGAFGPGTTIDGGSA